MTPKVLGASKHSRYLFSFVPLLLYSTFFFFPLIRHPFPQAAFFLSIGFFFISSSFSFSSVPADSRTWGNRRRVAPAPPWRRESLATDSTLSQPPSFFPFLSFPFLSFPFRSFFISPPRLYFPRVASTLIREAAAPIEETTRATTTSHASLFLEGGWRYISALPQLREFVRPGKQSGLFHRAKVRRPDLAQLEKTGFLRCAFSFFCRWDERFLLGRPHTGDSGAPTRLRQAYQGTRDFCSGHERTWHKERKTLRRVFSFSIYRLRFHARNLVVLVSFLGSEIGFVLEPWIDGHGPSWSTPLRYRVGDSLASRRGTLWLSVTRFITVTTSGYASWTSVCPQRYSNLEDTNFLLLIKERAKTLHVKRVHHFFILSWPVTKIFPGVKVNIWNNQILNGWYFKISK